MRFNNSEWIKRKNFEDVLTRLFDAIRQLPDPRVTCGYLVSLMQWRFKKFLQLKRAFGFTDKKCIDLSTDKALKGTWDF